jgi:GxxExxY protein
MHRFHNFTPLPEETEAVLTVVVDAGMTVHKQLGPGFVEVVYRNALSLELEARQVPFEVEKAFTVRYRDRPIAVHRVDLIVCDRIIVELKAVAALEEIHKAQVISYLKTTGLRAGLLMNFGGVTLRAGLSRIVL